MRMQRILALLIGWLLVSVNAPSLVLAETSGLDALAAAEQLITPALLAGPIRFLADDSLEGRGPGTRGDQLTRLYLATQMQTLGLQPGAGEGLWEQPVALVGVTTGTPARWEFSRADQVLSLDDVTDFVASSGIASERAAVKSAEVVFGGYGIQAPEYGWDDFKGADLRGKVLLLLNNDSDWDPGLFAGKRRLYYGRWTYKCESAARQGAIGAIIIHTPESAGYPWQTVQTTWTGENSLLPGINPVALQLKAWITEEAAGRLARLAGRDLKTLVESARRRDFVPVALGVITSLHLTNQLRHYASANVLGILPGRDAELRDEVVVYTAHHDHLGMKQDKADKTVIYNGAVDNAAGVAQLLAVARAFRALPEPSRRSILFLAVAAEEQGLLGSEYYATHPTVHPGRLVANLNFDGGNILGKTRDVSLIGYGKSSLDRIAERAAARQGRHVMDDQFPEQGFFYRSDQFNFARIGVPALFLDSGVDFVGRPTGWGRKQVDAWIAQHYHQPSDDFDSNWNLEGMVDDVRLAFAIGLTLAESAEMPSWAPGDEFEGARRKALAELHAQSPEATHTSPVQRPKVLAPFDKPEESGG